MKETERIGIMDLVGKLNRLLEEESLLPPGDRIVVAVSGGSDSTALLQLLFLLSGTWGWSLTAAHANHGFRPEESALEAEAVRSFAEERGIPFVYKELHVPAYLKERGGNPQDAARELRYRFLLETAKAVGASRIALAHHADDQAETVLMRLLRGTGITGLAGISMRRTEQNVELVRPLLRITKNELLEELRRQGIGYCTDSSNAKLDYTRNRIRLEALPYLARYNPSIVEALNRLAELASADDSFLEEEAGRVFGRLAVPAGEGIRFDRREFASLHVALQRRFLKLILNYVSKGTEPPDYGEVERIRGSLLHTGKPNAVLRTYGDILVVREYDGIRAEHRADAGFAGGSPPYRYPLEDADGELWVPEASCRMVYRTLAPDQAERGSGFTACFDAEALAMPLAVRNRREGDRMRPDGLNGSKKVKDIFIDHKVPAALRERMPLLVDRDGSVLWIPGVRRSDAAKVTAETRHVLCIHYLPA